MFKIRKAQGMSMNVIIIAVLALLVLVILSVIFTGKMRSTTTTMEECSTVNGNCIANEPDIYLDKAYEGSSAYCGGIYDKVSDKYQCPTGKICCIKGTTK